MAGLATISAPMLAVTETENAECVKSATFLTPVDSAAERQYAPDRVVQMLHLALDITPDFIHRTISATASLRFKPLVKPVRELKLDAVDLNIQSVTSTEKVQAWQTTDEQLVLTFAEPIPAGRETTVTVTYSAEPTSGLYFRTPEMGYKDGDTHLFTQGEEIDERHWYPCLDSPNQRFTSEITCRVPEGMTAISNGRLVSETKDSTTGLMAIHWSQEKPHANYLISLVAGYFKQIEDRCHDTPLAFCTPPSEIAYATNSFRDTRDIMEFFEQEIGVPFPWAKYYQVCVNDFVEGGMENTSATTLTDRTLFTPASENIRDSDSLVSHEMAHQWFGDLVTCKDWSQIWLNEGFATFYETLYNGHKNGRDNMLYELYGRLRQITSMTNDFNPIVRRTYQQPHEMFGYLVYPKAGWVLHMLRAQLGPELYRRCIKTYLERHQYGNVVTEDLREVIEELSGRSFDRFFDQWLYHGHFPELDVTYAWDEGSGLAKVTVQQTQDINQNVLLFQFPLTLRFSGKFGVTNSEVQVTRVREDFYVPLPMPPESVRIDPDFTLFAKIKFEVPRPMLKAQLADSHDVIGRLRAIEQLAARRDQDAVSLIKHTLNHDSFYGVRLEASKALRTIHTDDARQALLASLEQHDARVRRQVLEDLNGFYSEGVCTEDLQTLEREKNPEITAVALRGLGGYANNEVRSTLLKFLNSDSYLNELAVAAIQAVRSQDDPSYIEPLMDTLTKRGAAFTSRGFAQGLGAMAYLARNEQKKERVREFLLARVNEPRKTVQLGAIDALGVLGDSKSIAVLEGFANAGRISPESMAAERAILALRAGRKPVDDFKNLRQEVLDLEKANRDLRKEMDDLKRRLDAAGSPTAARVRSPRRPVPSGVASPKAQ